VSTGSSIRDEFRIFGPAADGLKLAASLVFMIPPSTPTPLFPAVRASRVAAFHRRVMNL
jgi:hypothetical protein